MLSPAILFNLVIGIIGSFQVFTTAFIATNGGPQNATLFYVLYLYRNAFDYFKMGYASALAWVLFLIVLGLTLVQFRLAKRFVYYEAEGANG
jgi:multiple sugar transport system permease protein